jgi:glycosyltransferase involved in cell wall biosynthesis
MKVTYYFRSPASQYFSIERVFRTVIKSMPSDVEARVVYSKYGRGFLRRVYNMFEARRRQEDINHITGDVHYLAMLLDPARTVLTVHDCGILERLKGWRREIARLLWFEWPVRHVAMVTVISDRTRNDLLRYTSCPPSKITVIPNPIPPDFRLCLKPLSKELPDLLQVGTSDNKNVENVAMALRGIRCHLTVIGRLSARQVALLESCQVNYSAAADISDSEVLDRYRQCDAVVFCSTYEGFGMPIIEANAIGRPVVTSDIEPLRSIAGGAACLVDPHDVASMRAGIMRVLTDTTYRNQLIQLGILNAAQYDARAVALRYRELYGKLRGQT